MTDGRTGDLRTLRVLVAQYQAYWGTHEETLENYVARIQKDEAVEIAKTNLMITSVIVYELAKM